jgi:hypothetical protein
MEIGYLFLRCGNCPHDRGTRPLVDERPQLIQLALMQMQAAEVVVHHPLTVPAQDRQPVVDGVFVYPEQLCRGANAQPLS